MPTNGSIFEGVEGVEANIFCSDLPVFDLTKYLNSPNDQDENVTLLCKALASCLKDTGALVIRDPRVDSQHNNQFISLMERYFSQSTEAKMADVRPHLAYQVGATPEGVERPRCLNDRSIIDKANALSHIDKPSIPTSADVKWRFFWRIGSRPKETRFKELNADPVTPLAFPEWASVMDNWGSLMINTVYTVAEMLALGFDLDHDAFTERMRLGPHLLAPTGTDLDAHGALGTVFAGYHYDLNFLTIHGRSRYPGLHIWLRDGRKIAVCIPEGCLLIQAGKQMEWLTGGAVKAGFHEVVCTEETLKAAEVARAAGRPAWRVSSTVFSQIASDEILRPLGVFATKESENEYPPVPSGKYVQEELEIINLRNAGASESVGCELHRNTLGISMMATPTDCHANKYSQLERLLEAAAGKGLYTEIDLNYDSPMLQAHHSEDDALVHTLLSICTRKSVSEWSSSFVTQLGCAGEGDLTIPLLNICARSTGVIQSLALQALKTWCDDHSSSIDQCIEVGAVPLLLSILSTSLPEAASGTPAAYTASMAVLLLKTIVRHNSQQCGESFLEAGGVDTLLHLLSHPSLDDKSLCLVLYLINDTSRRSIAVLDTNIDAGAVPLIVSILRQPVTEATKFAALILNRWSLAAQHVPTIRAAGSPDALFDVLINSFESNIDVDPETVAYALSAISIMSQDTVPDIRARVLSSRAAMTAISRAIAHYEGAFQGVGFPHAMLCMLLDGSEGADVVAALAAWGLLPAWLAARHVGTVLVERASQEDVCKALDSLTHQSDALEAAIAITHLLQRSPDFLPAALASGRLESLASGALTEFVSKSSGGLSPLSSEDMTSTTLVFNWDSAPVDVALDTLPDSMDEEMEERDIKEISCIAATAASDPCTGVAEDPRPQLAMLVSTPSRSSSETATVMLEALQPIEGSSRCTTALATLTNMTPAGENGSNNPAAFAGTVTEEERRRSKRARRDDESRLLLSLPSHAVFCRADVGVQRYDTLCFKVGGRDVHAVGFVLEAYSPFLRGLLSTLQDVHESVTVPLLAPFSPETMHVLFMQAVEWCYTGTVKGLDDHEDAFNLWIMAEFFQIDGLQRHCETVLSRWFVSCPEVLHRCMQLAEKYPSAIPMRRLVAQHVLSFILVLERCTEANLAVASLIAGHAATLAGDVADIVRSRLVNSTA